MAIIPANLTPQHFEIIAGDSLTLKITATVKSTGAAMDLTGAAIKWTANLTTPVSKTVGSGITITNAAGGLFEIAIDAGDLTEVGDFAHQCQVTIGGVVSTVMEGTVRIKTDYVS